MRIAIRPIIFFIFFLLRFCYSNFYAKSGKTGLMGSPQVRVFLKMVNCPIFRFFVQAASLSPYGEVVNREGHVDFSRAPD